MISEVQIIGVPVDLGTQRLGVDMGPNALRYFGLITILQQAGLRVKDLGNIAVPPPESRAMGLKNLKYLPEIVDTSERLAELTAEATKDGAFPLVLGGDHSLAIGSVAGFTAAAPRDFGFVWIDAHPDCNTPETTISGNIHGMSLAALLGSGHAQLVNCHRAVVKLHPDQVAMVGIKDVDPGEQTFMDQHHLRVYTMDDINARGLGYVLDELKQRFGGKPLYVSLDLDVIDSMFAPGVGIRSHGGLTYREIRYLCKTLSRHFAIAGLEVVEFNPIFDIDNQTAQLTIELIMTLLGHEHGDYQRYLQQQRF
jgi:arginase